MSDGREAQDHTFEEVTADAGGASQHLDLEDLMKVRLSVTVEIGTARMLVRNILEMNEGAVIPLNKIAGEMADLMCNGLPFGKGEVVVIGDTLHIRIAEISGVNELLEDGSGGA